MKFLKNYTWLIAAGALGLGLYLYFTAKKAEDGEDTTASKTAEFLGFKR